jgi:hypothetical protein
VDSLRTEVHLPRLLSSALIVYRVTPSFLSITHCPGIIIIFSLHLKLTSSNQTRTCNPCLSTRPKSLRRNFFPWYTEPIAVQSCSTLTAPGLTYLRWIIRPIAGSGCQSIRLSPRHVRRASSRLRSAWTGGVHWVDGPADSFHRSQCGASLSLHW